MGDKPGPDQDYGIENSTLLFIQQNILDLGMCFDKRDKGAWELHICSVPCKVPQYYLLGCCCPCCVAFDHREYLLNGKMYEEYACCQEKYGKCWCTPLARKIPHCCLIAEVFCCTGCAIAGNRFAMNEKYMVKDSLTETIILIAAAVLAFFGFFGQIIGCWVNGVLNGQQEEHISKNEGSTTLAPYAKWGKGENNCWEIWKCEPCCGEPCNFMDGLRCAACWLLPCCSLCTISKFYASSLKEEECTVMGHALPYIVALLCAMFVPIPVFNSAGCLMLRVATRHNFRHEEGTGDPRYMFGDFLMATCCSACGLCQELRASPADSWDWLKQYQEKSIEVGEPNSRFFIDDR